MKLITLYLNKKSTILCHTTSGDQFLKHVPKFLVQIFARKSHFWPTFNRVQFDPTWLYLFINAKLHEKRLYLSVDGFSSALLTLISSFLIFFFLLLLLRRLPSTTGENLPRHTHPHFHAFPAFFLFYLFFQEKFIQLLVFNFSVGTYLLLTP